MLFSFEDCSAPMNLQTNLIIAFLRKISIQIQKSVFIKLNDNSFELLKTFEEILYVQQKRREITLNIFKRRKKKIDLMIAFELK